MGGDGFAIFDGVPIEDGGVLCAGLTLAPEGDWIRLTRPLVTESEWMSAQRFVHEIDAQRHLAGRALVRRVLGLGAGGDAVAAFDGNAWGKPRLSRSDVAFSISHSGRMVWAAFCRGREVGIDIEEIRPLPDVLDLAAMLHPTEREAIAAQAGCGRMRAFFRCWTRKEAVLKALGRGMSQPLDSFAVAVGAENDGWYRPLSWTSRDLPVASGYAGSVAAAAPGLRLTVVTG